MQLLIALDQLINALLSGMADETLSARAFRRELQGRSDLPRRAIDAMFFWQADHCYRSWRSEIERQQLPNYYRLENT